MADDAVYKVAYDEAVRALSEQQAAIESVRARAGLLLSAAVVTTSFLGAQALQAVHRSAFSWPALIAFVVMATVSLAILWPRDWDGTANPREIIERIIESERPSSAEELYRALSLHMHESYLRNRQGLEEFALLFEIVGASLAVEVVLWIAAIASSS